MRVLIERKEKDRGRERKNEKQKNTGAAVSVADKGHSADKVGTNMFLIVSPGLQQTLERLPGPQNHRHAQMSEIFMFNKNTHPGWMNCLTWQFLLAKIMKIDISIFHSQTRTSLSRHYRTNRVNLS